ncbi:hypothetical protein [Bacillus mycoides]|nr:hypothetical protein [Bacillus mycoides]
MVKNQFRNSLPKTKYPTNSRTGTFDALILMEDDTLLEDKGEAN